MLADSSCVLGQQGDVMKIMTCAKTVAESSSEDYKKKAIKNARITTNSHSLSEAATPKRSFSGGVAYFPFSLGIPVNNKARQVKFNIIHMMAVLI